MELLFLFYTGFCLSALLLAIYFLTTKKGDKVSNLFMAGLIASFGYYLFYCILYWSNNVKNTPALLLTYYFPMSTMGALFYLYIRRTLGLQTKWKHYLLCLFPLFLTFFAQRNFIFLAVEDRLPMLRSLRAGTYEKTISEYLLRYLDITLVGFIVIFTLLSAVLIRKNTEDKSNNIQAWYKILLYAFVGLAAGFVIDYIFIYANLYSFSLDYAITFFMIVSIAVITYFALWQPDIYAGTPISRLNPFTKYSRAGLTREHGLELKQELLTYMEKEKPYLNSELRLEDIADRLNISRNHASQVINEHFKKTFFDFVNTYRVEEAAGLLEANPDRKISVSEVIYRAGFNNKVSFYKAFKKIKGITPLEYRKEKITKNGS